MTAKSTWGDDGKEQGRKEMISRSKLLSLLEVKSYPNFLVIKFEGFFQFGGLIFDGRSRKPCFFGNLPLRWLWHLCCFKREVFVLFRKEKIAGRRRKRGTVRIFISISIFGNMVDR